VLVYFRIGGKQEVWYVDGTERGGVRLRWRLYHSTDDGSVQSRVLRKEKGVELTLKPGSFDKFPYLSLSCQGCAFVPNSHCFLSLSFVHSTFVGLVGNC